MNLLQKWTFSAITSEKWVFLINVIFWEAFPCPLNKKVTDSETNVSVFSRNLWEIYLRHYIHSTRLTTFLTSIFCVIGIQSVKLNTPFSGISAFLFIPLDELVITSSAYLAVFPASFNRWHRNLSGVLHALTRWLWYMMGTLVTPNEGVELGCSYGAQGG